MTSPLYRFMGNNIIPRDKITLLMEMGVAPLIAHHLMEFLVVDHRSTYHGVLGRSALKGLWAVTSIYHLCMMFPMENCIATVRGAQQNIRECYFNSIRKAEPRSVNVILMDIDEDNDPE